MRGSALSFSAAAPDLLAQDYDLLVATSTVDLSVVQSLYPKLRQIPSLLYFHENQYAYPTENSPKNMIDWQMVNLYSAMRANTLVFNSQYNQTSFMNGVAALLRKMPDLVPKNLVDDLQAKACVVPVPIPDLSAGQRDLSSNGPITILWNHRWEWDKNPDLLLEIVNQLKSHQVAFQLIITGQHFRKIPPALTKLKDHHADVILHVGYVETKADYREWLSKADIVLSTAIHEFQGIAVMEAVQAGCIPLLPCRLSYPEFFSEGFLYSANGDTRDQAAAAVKQLQNIIQNPPKHPDLTALTEASLTEKYNRILRDTLNGSL